MEQIIDRFLNEVTFKMGTLREARSRFSAQLAPEFRIFDYLRTDEMGVSWCIACLLDPNGTHGQGRVFLDTFLKGIGTSPAWASAAEDCRVLTEKQANGQRRIDIYLDFPKDGVIGIENKPWAGDQNQQLTDYAAFLKKAAGNRKWLLIYLSNRDPSEESIKAVERKELEEVGQFVRLEYVYIIKWLNECACKSKSIVVRIFIEELEKFIQTEINGDLDMSDEQEMKSVILRSTDNLRSAFHVSKAIDSVKKELLENFRKALEVNLTSHSMKLGWDLEGWQAYSGFIVQFSELPQSLNLRFEFDQTNLSGFFWGIAKNNGAYKDDQVWKIVNDLMSANFHAAKSSNYWPWYSVIPDNEFSVSMKNWRVSEEPWMLIKDGGLAKKITDLALRVREVLKEQHHILHKGDPS